MAAIKDSIPVAYVRECLVYDPETGAFTWKRRPRAPFNTQSQCDNWNIQFVGKPAGTDSHGYLQICITANGRRRQYLARRVAFALMTGRCPERDIDHHNGVRNGNRWSNLREATHA
jgi:HNH endonuclease